MTRKYILLELPASTIISFGSENLSTRRCQTIQLRTMQAGWPAIALLWRGPSSYLPLLPPRSTNDQWHFHLISPLTRTTPLGYAAPKQTEHSTSASCHTARSPVESSPPTCLRFASRAENRVTQIQRRSFSFPGTPFFLPHCGPDCIQCNFRSPRSGLILGPGDSCIPKREPERRKRKPP